MHAELGFSVDAHRDTWFEWKPGVNRSLALASASTGISLALKHHGYTYLVLSAAYQTDSAIQSCSNGNAPRIVFLSWQEAAQFRSRRL